MKRNPYLHCHLVEAATDTEACKEARSQVEKVHGKVDRIRFNFADVTGAVLTYYKGKT